jgi:hypothetical protein
VRRRTLLWAALAAAVLIAVVAVPAGAMTLHGRILGQPQVHGAHARVPILLSSGRIAVLAVPAKSGFRTVASGRTSAPATRLGDVVRARVGALRAGAGRARYLAIVQRSPAPTFADLAARLSASSDGAKTALEEVGRIAKAEKDGPQDPAQLRLFLLDLRYKLNVLIADLRRQAAGMEKAAGDVRGSGDLVDQLDKASRGARSAARDLENGVAGLDEFINSLGALNGAGLPAGGADVVAQLLATAQQVLGELAPAVPAPGTPALPSPLGGLPVPPLP